MMLNSLRLKLALLSVLLFCCSSAWAQITFPWVKKDKHQVLPSYDTLRVKAGKLVLFPDTLFIPTSDTTFVISSETRVKVKENPSIQTDRFYDSLASLSNRSVLTKKLHSLLFRSSVTELSDSIRLLRSEAPFEPYEGYRIGEIKISNAEFLASDIVDTTEVARTSIAKAIDLVHADTKEVIVRNNLLFQSGDLVRSFLLADNERILRRLPYIRDARIVLLPDPDKDEVVDVYVITQDRLSLFIDGDFGGFDDFALELGSRNIFGTGNQFSVVYQYDRDERPESGYELRFTDFNIRGTFISSDITYSNLWNRKGYNVNFQREFLTPATKWAGGFEFGDLEQIRLVDNELDSIPSDDDSLRIPYQRNFQDAWIGRAFLMKSGGDRVNLSVATRVMREDFTKRPDVDADSNYFFHNSVLWLNELVLTKRKFLKSTMIQTFAITEDIPVGYFFQIIAGYEYAEFVDRPYWGFGAGAGDFFNGIGYFNGTVEIGGFVEDRKYHDGVVSIDGLYFSPLLRLGRNHFRQFVSFNYSSALEPLEEDVFGFKEDIRSITGEIQGNKKFSVNIESVLFHPLRLYGFRIASYAFYDFGWISYNSQLIQKENFHSAIGIGFRLRNESLLFRAIQVRLGYLTAESEVDFNFTFSGPTIFDSFTIGKPDVAKF